MISGLRVDLTSINVAGCFGLRDWMLSESD